MPVVVAPAALMRRAFQTTPPDASFFTSGASPPIIIGLCVHSLAYFCSQGTDELTTIRALASICLGAFTFGILTVACWRRTHMRQARRSSSSSRSKLSPQKPRLHEVVLNVEKALEDKDEGKPSGTWAQVMVRIGHTSGMHTQPTYVCYIAYFPYGREDKRTQARV